MVYKKAVFLKLFSLVIVISQDSRLVNSGVLACHDIKHNSIAVVRLQNGQQISASCRFLVKYHFKIYYIAGNVISVGLAFIVSFLRLPRFYSIRKFIGFVYLSRTIVTHTHILVCTCIFFTVIKEEQ